MIIIVFFSLLLKENDLSSRENKWFNSWFSWRILFLTLHICGNLSKKIRVLVDFRLSLPSPHTVPTHRWLIIWVVCEGEFKNSTLVCYILQLYFVIANSIFFAGHLSKDLYQMGIYSMKVMTLYQDLVLSTKISRTQHHLEHYIHSIPSACPIQI